MFCVKCGKTIDDNAKFCKYCGSAIGNAAESVDGDRHDLNINGDRHGLGDNTNKSSGRKSELKKNSSIIVLLVVLIMMIAVVAILVGVILNGNSSNSSKSTSKSYSKNQDDEDDDDDNDDADEENSDSDDGSSDKKKGKEKNPAELAKDSLEIDSSTVAMPAPAAEPAVEEAAPAVETAEAWVDTEEALSAADLKVELENCINAYKDIWDEYNNNGYVEVSLIYVDDDFIPELVLHGDCEASGNIIYTYHNGSIEELYISRLNFSYVPRKNIIDNCDGHMGYYYNLIYSIRNHQFATLHEGYISELISDNGEDFSYEYTWDGMSVSESEYTKNLNELYDATKAISSYGMNKYKTVEAAMADL